MLAPCDAILWILDTRLVFFADASAPSLFTSTQQPLSDTKTVLQLNFLKTIVFLAPKCSNKRAISTICIASFSITLHCSLLFSLILVIPCMRTLRMCFVTRAGKGGPIRTFCICHFLFFACSCIFPFPLFQLSQGNILTSGVCHLDLFRERECSLVAIARQTCRRSLGKLSYFES